MIMFEQSRRLSQPLRWGRRERVVVATLLSAVLLAVLGLGTYALTSGGAARRDCIDVTFASTLGGAEIHGCGSRARSICASGAFHGIEQPLRASCRRAGFAFVGRR
jgi:hypothetical protein